MRWEALFADLEGQVDAADAAQDAAQVAALTRAEIARTALADRLRAHGGAPASLLLRDGRWASGQVVDVAQAWVLLAGPAGGAGAGPERDRHAGRDGAGAAPGRTLVVLAAVERVRDLTRRSVPGGGVVASLGVGAALRALARDREPVTVMLASGDLTGTIDRVGQDHLDVAVHPPDLPRRPSSVTETATVTLAALLGVRSAGA